MTKHDEFSRRLTANLDHGLQHIEALTAQRLYLMRQRALAENRTTHSPQTILAWVSKPTRMAAILALGCVFAGFFFIQSTRQAYSPETDILLLTGELPPSVYADNTFSQWLETRATF